jgi:hypothetical protein
MRLNGSRNVAAESAAYSSSVSTFAAVNARERKSANGTIGSLAFRSSGMNAMSAATPAIDAARTGVDDQPRAGASMNAKTTPPRPSVTRNVPSQSMAPARFPASRGTCSRTIQSTAMAIGALMRNTARHEIVCTSTPPSSGPAMTDSEVSADHVPIARPRSSRGNVAAMIARLPGTSSAAPPPCSARAMISCAVVCAAPQQSDAAAKIATPMANTRARPSRSPSEPPARISADSTSR